VPPSRTAQYVALYRAFETTERRRPPLFRDPFARAFLPPRLTFFLDAARLPIVRRLVLRYADRRAPGARTSAIARTAYIDDAVRAAAARGVRQVVLLGAGYDCRAHRMPELRAARVFEVDRDEIQALKRARLADLGARGDVRYVAVDFQRDDLGVALSGAGWSGAEPSLVIWEGVTGYLTEPAVVAVLRWAATMAAGSRIVFTYIHAGVLDGSVAFAGGRKLVDNVRRLGEPWRFGLHPEKTGAFVAAAGLRLIADVGADEYRRTYLPEVGVGYGFYRIATAEAASG
jgi:methyltransferase (TIGR00027 family)